MVVANEAGAYAATRHLLRMGHRNLAVITGPLHLTNAAERLKGFRRALDEARISIEPEYVQEARRQPGDPAPRRLPARRLRAVPGLTGEAMLDYLAELRGGVDRRVRDGLAERFDAQLDRPIRELSTGNRQKLGLIQAFMHEPELLILDEPIAGLDPLVQQSFHALLGEVAAQGRTVLPLLAHALGGRAGGRPRRDPAPRAPRRRRLAREPPRGRGAAAGDRVRRRRARGRGVARAPGRARGPPRRPRI